MTTKTEIKEIPESQETSAKKRKVELDVERFINIPKEVCTECSSIWKPNREYNDLCMECIKNIKRTFMVHLQRVRTLRMKHETFGRKSLEGGGSSSSLEKYRGVMPLGENAGELSGSSADNISELRETLEAKTQTKEGSRKRPRETEEAPPKSPPSACVKNPVVEQLVAASGVPQLKLHIAEELWEACNKMDLEKLKEIIKAHPEALLTYDEYGESILHRAVYVPDTKVLKLLIELGINIHIFNPVTGSTSLHRAVVSRRLDVVTFLLEHGASPNSREFNGQTPLHAAVLGDYCEIAKVLLEKGADILALTVDKTPIEMALSDKMRNLLQEYEAKK
jgi:hypothetical protein